MPDAAIIHHHDLGRCRNEMAELEDEAIFRRFVDAFSAEVAKSSPLGRIENYFEAIAAAALTDAATCALPDPDLDRTVIAAYALRLQRYRGQLDYLAADDAFQCWVERVAALEQLSFVLKAAAAVGIDTRQLTVWA